MFRKLAYFSLTIFVLSLFIGCEKQDKPKEISLEKKELADIKPVAIAGKPLRIAVGGMITPKEGFAYYKKLLDYIGEKIDRNVEFVDRENYKEINELLKKGDIDIAFVCSGPYVDGHKEFDMQLLVAPSAYGGTVYYSYIIVPQNSPVKSLKELRGKKFVFTDPLSNTGKLVPTYMLAKMKETPDSFFSHYDFTYKHDKSIRAVAEGVVDGAAVDSLIWEYLNRTNPEFTSRTKVIEKSPPYGIPPVVVRPGLEKELKEKLKQVFMNVHNDEKGREILKGMMIDKFIEIDDKAYDSIREMKSWVAKQDDKKSR
ncbi:MAG: phosphate/phosphite/phosphonate ABC transporter substrate-binding protein [Nitrospirota bacterium]